MKFKIILFILILPLILFTDEIQEEDKERLPEKKKILHKEKQERDQVEPFNRNQIQRTKEIKEYESTLTEEEQKWINESKQKLGEKAEKYKQRTGFTGTIYFHHNRATLSSMEGKIDCISVVDSSTAITAADQILDEIIDLINVPRNQIQRTKVFLLKQNNQKLWSVNYLQYLNGIKIINTGSRIIFHEDGTFSKCYFNLYPELTTDIRPQYTKEQLQEKIRKEHNLTTENILINDKYYYRAGMFGELTLLYETMYSDYEKDGYCHTYIDVINTTSGEILNKRKSKQKKRFYPEKTSAELVDFGWQLFEEGNFENAVQCFEELIARKDSLAQAYLGLGWSKLRLYEPIDTTKTLKSSDYVKNKFYIVNPYEIYDFYKEDDFCPRGWVNNAIKLDGNGEWIVAREDLLPIRGTVYEEWIGLDDGDDTNNENLSEFTEFGDQCFENFQYDKIFEQNLTEQDKTEIARSNLYISNQKFEEKFAFKEEGAETYHFKGLYRDKDYTYNEKTGIITFNFEIKPEYTIGVAYLNRYGFIGYPHKDFGQRKMKIIKRENQGETTDTWVYQVKNYYEFGKDMLHDDFKFDVINTRQDSINNNFYIEENMNYLDYLRVDTNHDKKINHLDTTLDLNEGWSQLPFIRPFEGIENKIYHKISNPEPEMQIILKGCVYDSDYLSDIKRIFAKPFKNYVNKQYNYDRTAGYCIAQLYSKYFGAAENLSHLFYKNDKNKYTNNIYKWIFLHDSGYTYEDLIVINGICYIFFPDKKYKENSLEKVQELCPDFSVDLSSVEGLKLLWNKIEELKKTYFKNNGG